MSSSTRARVRKSWKAALAGIALTLAASASAQGHQYTITIANMAYAPAPAGLKVGDTVTWVNNDSVLHTVTARDHSFDLRLAPRQRGSVTLAKAGQVQIYCIIHSQMRSSLTVGR